MEIIGSGREAGKGKGGGEEEKRIGMLHALLEGFWFASPKIAIITASPALDYSLQTILV